jgi:hypothetical protein
MDHEKPGVSLVQNGRINPPRRRFTRETTTLTFRCVLIQRFAA